MSKNIIKNLDALKIQSYQRSRFPTLFVDFITEVLPGKYAKGHKCFTINEWFFQGHFQDDPNVPSFIITESMEQIFLMTFLTMNGNAMSKTATLKVEEACFMEKIIPGQQLNIYAELDSLRHGIAKGGSIGYINDKPVCKAKFVVAMLEIIENLKPK